MTPAVRRLAEDVGAQLYAARQSRGWLQGDVAKAVGISVPMVSLVERGKRLPSLDTLIRYSKALDLTCRMFMDPS